MLKTKGVKGIVSKKGIAQEIIANVAKMVAGIILVIAFFSIFMLVRSVKSGTTTELTLESQGMAYQLTSVFEGFESMTEVMAVNTEINVLMRKTVAGDDIRQTEGFSNVFSNLWDAAQLDKENILATWIADIDANMVTQSDNFTSGDGWQFYDRPWSVCVEQGHTIVTEPYIDASTGQTIMSVVTPIYDDNGNGLGVVGMDITLEQMISMMSQHKVGKEGYLMLISANGLIVYHPNQDLIQTYVTDMDISDAVKTAVVNGEEGYFGYKALGESKYGYLAQIGTTGFMVLSSMTSGEFYSSIIATIIGLAVVFVVCAVLLIIGLKKVSEKLAAPIRELNGIAMQLADGNLDVEINVASDNEIGELADSIEATVVRLKEYIVYIDEIAEVLAQMADGKLVIHLKQDYAGEFQKVKAALLNISESMTSVMTGITDSAAQVSDGADELARAAQSLAESAGTQAAAVEELLATTTMIAEQVESNKKDAEGAAVETENVTSMMESSQGQMNQMIDAMEKIRLTSQQVVGVIHAIEEIADQTNLLSLNASIEAARAGEVGKGFAVVAGEIGKLAEESGKAVNTTRDLIQESMNEIAHGNQIVESVVASIRSSVEAIEHVNGMIQKTSENATFQAMNMEQIKIGIEDISQGIQDSSAIAQESSATSEELAAQATTLNEMVQKFEI